MKFPLFKMMPSRFGVLVSPRWIHYCNGVLNYLSVGRWLPGRLADRPQLGLVMHLDADLDSPTVFVLRLIRPHLRVGSRLISDEFIEREHGMKVLGAIPEDQAIKLKLVAVTRALTQVAFRVTQTSEKSVP